MQYLARLKMLQKRERTDFTQFMQVPTGDFSDQSAKVAADPPVVASQGDASQNVFSITKELALGVNEPNQQPQEEKLENNALYDSCKNCVKSDDKHERDFAQFLQLPNNESVVQTVHRYEQVDSEIVGEQTSLSLNATNDLSLVGDDEPSDAIQDDLGFELPKLLPQQAPEANCTNCGKSSTDANESGNRGESENTNGSCRICRYVSRFGNCTVPIASGLSEKFMLISHPQKGVGCVKFQPSISEKTAHVLHLIDRALRIKAVDEEGAERAGDAVLRADSIDYQCVIEYESLIRASIRSTEKGKRRDDS